MSSHAVTIADAVEAVHSLAVSAPAGTAVAAGMHARTTSGWRRWCWYAAAPIAEGWGASDMPIVYLDGRCWTHRGAVRAQREAQAVLTGAPDPGLARLDRAALGADVLAMLAVLIVLVVTLAGDRAVLLPAAAAFVAASIGRVIRDRRRRRSHRTG